MTQPHEGPQYPPTGHGPQPNQPYPSTGHAPQPGQPGYGLQPGYGAQPGGQGWSDPHGRSWPGTQPPAAAPKGAGLAIAALVLSLIGLVVPFLPTDMTGFRNYVAFPFAIPALILAIAALASNRRGKALAVIACPITLLALGIGLLMTIQRL